MDRLSSHLPPEQLLADSRWLRGLAKGLANDHGTDDLAQETWLSFLRKPPRLLANVRPWLRTVARNLAFRDHDRQSRRTAREAEAARAECVPSTADLVARASLRRSVVDAVLDLAEPYRSTILLRFFEELAPRQIARRLGIPVATVRTRVRRGLDQLRSKLSAEHGSNRAWIALLVPARGFITGAWMTGAVVMGTKLKVAGAVVVVLGALGFWQWSRSKASSGEEAAEPASSYAATTLAPVSRPAGAVSVETAASVKSTRPRPAVDEPDGIFGITGLVVDDRTDRPVEGVVAKPAAWTERPESVAKDATTDQDGKFRIPVHDKKRLRAVTLLSPDYAPLVLDQIENDLHKAGGEALDLGTLRLLRGARVTGRVVSAETGEPVAEARLFWSPFYPVTQKLLSEARSVGRSGGDGTFVLAERVPPQRGDSEEVLAAVAEDGVGWTFLAVVKDRESLDGVEITISKGASVRTTVIDEAGKPVAGAQVSAVPRFPPLGPPGYFEKNYSSEWLPDSIRDRFGGRSGEDGMVVVRGLPIGRSDERFRQYPSSPTGYDITVTHPQYVRPEPRRIQVDPAKETLAEVKLVRRKTCVVRGTVTSESGLPIADAHLNHAGHQDAIVTDREGRYRFEGQDTAEGRVYLEVRAPGFAKLYREVALSAGTDEVVADFVLLKAAPISGRVVDQDGHPVPSAYVDILDGDTGPNRRQYRPDGDGNLDGEGRFVFSNATAGQWTLRVHGPEPSAASGEWAPGHDQVVEGGTQNLEVVLRRLAPARARLEAEIVDATTGAAVDPAEVRLYQRTTTFSGEYGSSPRAKSTTGRVTVERIRPGPWTLFVRLVDGSRASREFAVSPEDTIVKLRLEIGRPGIVIARVDLSQLPADHRPSSVAIWTNPYDAVQWTSKPGVPVPDHTRGVGVAKLSNDWTVRFEDVTPNVPIRFWTTSDSSTSAEAVVTVGFGEEKEIVLRPVPSAKVTFKKPDRAPGAGVTVSVKLADGSWSQVDWTTWEADKPWQSEHDFMPGRLAWKAERYALDVDPEERRPVVVEGDLDLKSGESREVPVIFP